MRALGSSSNASNELGHFLRAAILLLYLGPAYLGLNSSERGGQQRLLGVRWDTRNGKPVRMASETSWHPWEIFPLTVCRRQMFSRRDPMQPQKVSRNMRTPTTMSRMAGSTARQAKAASEGRGPLCLCPAPPQGLGKGCP